MININREELAWAAGFFDGEGHTKVMHPVRRYGNKPTTRLQLSIAQVSKETLEKFKSAVGSLGKIYGPYGPYKQNQKPYYQYTTTTYEEAQAVIAMLWHWLGSIKRNQASISNIIASLVKSCHPNRNPKDGRFISVRA